MASSGKQNIRRSCCKILARMLSQGVNPSSLIQLTIGNHHKVRWSWMERLHVGGHWRMSLLFTLCSNLPLNDRATKQSSEYSPNMVICQSFYAFLWKSVVWRRRPSSFLSCVSSLVVHGIMDIRSYLPLGIPTSWQLNSWSISTASYQPYIRQCIGQ